MAYSTGTLKRRRRRRRRSVRLPYLTLLAWMCIFAAGYATMAPGSTGSGAHAKLALCERPRQHDCVVDGDTIRFGGSTIRIEDIDAPETGEPKCASEGRLGRRATLRLLELVNVGPFEVVYTGGRDTDVYGRTLRRIERDGRSLGDTLVAEGLARPWNGARRSWC
jgi:endonuclease YncB( thermonuclease family)